MKRALKGLALLVAVLLAVGGAGIGYLAVKPPKRHPASSETFERTPARLARGEYLTRHVTDCFGCHSEFDTSRFGYPSKPGTIGQGGFLFDDRYGVPGKVCAQNITPDPENGLGRWSDGEVLRALREGIDKNGDALFPMMPYRGYHALSDEDAKSIVVYLRTIPAVSHAVPKKELRFPVNLLVKSAPLPVDGPQAAPDDAKDHLAYGKYLVTIAGCADCHAPHDEHQQVIEGQGLSGGWVLALPTVRVVCANITPHQDTFMGQATKEQFIGRFRAFAGEPPLATPGRNTAMPWLALSGATDQDLSAIYDYLKAQPPVENKVEPFPDAPKQ
jgi:mono/diheme cytochrome c family protein